MSDEHNLSRSQLIETLKSIRPVVMDLTMTFDMGIECTIATKNGVVYPVPGMYLFCGGDWPIRKLSPSDEGFVKERNIFSLRTSEEDELLFTDVEALETAFLEMFNIDARWEEMDDSELADWHEAISSEGISIVAMSNDEEE
jgi:hypothetical protein